MSGADEDEEAGPPGLPPGTPFYMTPAGATALRAEVKRLWEEERSKVVEIVSWAAALGALTILFNQALGAGAKDDAETVPYSRACLKLVLGISREPREGPGGKPGIQNRGERGPRAPDVVEGWRSC